MNCKTAAIVLSNHTQAAVNEFEKLKGQWSKYFYQATGPKAQTVLLGHRSEDNDDPPESAS